MNKTPPIAKKITRTVIMIDATSSMGEVFDIVVKVLKQSIHGIRKIQ